MSKIKKQYSCSNCGSVTNKWSGQCPDCNLWGTIEEEISKKSSEQNRPIGNPQKIATLSTDSLTTVRTPTKIEELNRVLGGGLVVASAILIGGDPGIGIGKSTLLLQLATSLSADNLSCL
jgi:DNA repair protein RadA/Sms